jgi:hypothetical protein
MVGGGGGGVCDLAQSSFYNPWRHLAVALLSSFGYIILANRRPASCHGKEKEPRKRYKIHFLPIGEMYMTSRVGGGGGRRRTDKV